MTSADEDSPSAGLLLPGDEIIQVIQKSTGSEVIFWHSLNHCSYILWLRQQSVQCATFRGGEVI